MPTLTEEQIQAILDAAGPRADQIRSILGEDLEPEVEETKEEESSDEESSSEE